MQNQIIKYNLTDNTVDNYLLVNPTKQQVAFFPKEESQVLPGRTYDYTSDTDPQTRTEDTDTIAFINNTKTDGTPNFSLVNITGTLPADNASYSLKLNSINSSHTPTDYIGSVINYIPTTLNDTFTDYKLVNFTTNNIADLYPSTDTNVRVTNIYPGLQKFRIPSSIFNTVLTNATDILNNNGSSVKPNYGIYYLLISPKYLQTSIVDITEHYHQNTISQFSNANNNSTTSNVNVQPTRVRRTIIECANTDFSGTIWSFETYPNQAGRLYSSVVEIWDSTLTVLKQTKIITENILNIGTGNNTELVLQPDIIGYDTASQAPSVGDILKIYPRETYFDNIIVEVNYNNPALAVNNLVAFMLNDAVRDVSNGLIEVYDNNGLTVDTSGNINGNVIQSYQITQYGNYEIRKKTT